MRGSVADIQKERIKDFFSTTARLYKKKYCEEKLDFQTFTFLARRKNIISMIADECYKNAHRFKHCLDIGCGTGDYLVELLSFTDEVIGADNAQLMLSVARENIKGHEQRIKLYQEDIENLSFSDDCFDVVICAGVLEYIYDDTKALSEIYRVLKPGGFAYITFPNKLSPFMQFDRLYSHFLHFGGDILDKLKMFEFILGRKRTNISPTAHYIYNPRKIKQKIKNFGFQYKSDVFSGYGSFYMSVKIPFYHLFAYTLEYLNRFSLLRYGGLNYIIQVKKY